MELQSLKPKADGLEKEEEPETAPSNELEYMTLAEMLETLPATMRAQARAMFDQENTQGLLLLENIDPGEGGGRYVVAPIGEGPGRNTLVEYVNAAKEHGGIPQSHDPEKKRRPLMLVSYTLKTTAPAKDKQVGRGEVVEEEGESAGYAGFQK